MVAGIATIVGAVTGAVTGAVMGILTPEVSRALESCRNLKKNKNTLRRRVEELNVLKDDIVELRRNIRRGKMMKKEVEHWLSCVKIIYEEVQVVEKLCSVISGRCLVKAWLGETVLGKIEEVKELLRQHGNFSGDFVIDVKKNFKKLEVIGILMPAVSRKLEYCRNLKKNMNTLREGVAELNQLKDDIVDQQEVVAPWLLCVELIRGGLKDVEKLCSAGSRSFCAKASLGETVLRKIDEVEKLIRQHESFSGDIVIDRASTSRANKELKHALDRLNSQKEKVETQKSRHENAGEVVREEVNDWLIDVRSINTVIQILKDASRWVSPCNKRKFSEIVLEKSHAVNILLQRGTFPDGIVIDNRRKPKRGSGHVFSIGYMLLYLFVTISCVALDLAATTYFMF